MAVYGIDFYGTTTYGAPAFIQLEARNFAATPVEYDQIRLTWTTPSGTGDADWDQIRLVRSSYGFPTSETDGTLLFEDTRANARTSYLDTDLQPGRFYYYSLLCRLTSDGTYRIAGRVLELVTREHGYGERLWNYLPFLYHERDPENKRVHETGPLHRFMQMFGYQTDRLRTEMETLLDISNLDIVSGNLLPVIASSLGVPYEPELGMRISRSIAQNAIHLAKTKGTEPGVEGIATAYTNFAAEAVIGPNLMLDFNDSGWVEPDTSVLGSATKSFENNTTGDFSARSNAALSVGQDINAPDGGNVLVLEAVAAGDVIAGTPTGTDGYEVTPGRYYMAEVYAQANSDPRQVSIAIEWYDGGGALQSTKTSPTASDIVGGYNRFSVDAVAPSGAAYAALVLTVTAAGAGGEQHYFDAVEFVPANVGHWYASQNASLGRYSEVAFSPAEPNTGTMRIIPDGVGDAVVLSGRLDDLSLIPVSPSTDYVASASIQNEGMARDVTISVVFYDIQGIVLLTADSVAMRSSGVYQRIEATGTTPSNAAWAAVRLQITAPAAGDSHVVSAVQFEEGTTASDWESARQVNIYLGAQRTNLVPNPSFENDTAGWAAVAGGGSIARSTVQAYSGDASLLMTNNTGGIASLAVSSERIDVAEGEAYTASAYFRDNGTARNVTVDLHWYDAGGARILISPGVSTAEVAATFTRASVTASAPSTAVEVLVRLSVASTADLEEHYLDAVLFERTEFLKEYFDASLLPMTNYYWSGSPHASASNFYPRRNTKDSRLRDVMPKYLPPGTTFSTNYGREVPASAV